MNFNFLELARLLAFPLRSYYDYFDSANFHILWCKMILLVFIVTVKLQIINAFWQYFNRSKSVRGRLLLCANINTLVFLPFYFLLKLPVQ